MTKYNNIRLFYFQEKNDVNSELSMDGNITFNMQSVGSQDTDSPESPNLYLLDDYLVFSSLSSF